MTDTVVHYVKNYGKVAVPLDYPEGYNRDLYGNEMALLDSMPECVQEVLRDNPNRVNISDILADPQARDYFEKATPEDFATWLKRQLDWSNREIRTAIRKGLL